jgi:DNA adenine methylase
MKTTLLETVDRPVMRYHGAKFRLAPWILSFFPPHQTYVEPYGGAAGVLMQKPRTYAEVYNDLDDDIVNVFRVLQDRTTSEILTRLLTLTPYARREFELAYEPSLEPVERARRTLVRVAMGFGSSGSTKGSTGFRSDMQRTYGTASHLWAEYPDLIARFCQRLQGVLIENRPALACIRQYDHVDTLHYIDPPYVLDTRVTLGHHYYRHEMSDAEHEELLNVLLALDGFVIVSGYETDLYDDYLSGWEKHRTQSRISSGRGTSLRTECVWLNPRCADLQRQQRFDWDAEHASHVRQTVR